MCKLTEKSKLKEFTGYKSVYEKDGKYYSPVTGIEYVEGMILPIINVEDVKDEYTFGINHWKTPKIIFTNFFSPNLQGRTAVFRTFEGARLVSTDPSGRVYDIVKMTISDDIMEGYITLSKCFNVLAGKKIVKIEKINYENY